MAADLVEIVRSGGLVDRDDAVSAFAVLVPIVEAGPNDQAAGAARRIIERMPATDSLTAVLDWWLVVTTGTKAAVGTAYHLPEEISGDLRDAMDALIHMGTPNPPARWLAARRELAQRLTQLDERLELDHYGKSKLPREREVWAELLQWTRPVTDALRAGRRAKPFEFDSGRYERAMKRADINPNSRRWREMVKRAEQLTGFLDALVALQAEVEPWVDRGEPPSVRDVPNEVRRATEPLTEALLHPVLEPSSQPHGDGELDAAARRHVAEQLERAAAGTDDDGRFWLSVVARAWMERHDCPIAALDDIRRRHDAIRDGVERLRELGHDVTAIDVALLDDDLSEAERLFEDESERVSRDRQADQLRRSIQRLREQASGTELEGTAEWSTRLDDIARLVDSADHRAAARALGDATSRLRAATRDTVLRRAGELLDELEQLVAPRSLLLEKRGILDQLVAEPQRPVEEGLTTELEDAVEQLRRRRWTEAEGSIAEAKRLLGAERAAIAPDDVDRFELALTSVESDLGDGHAMSALAGAQRLLAEIGRHRVRRWEASEGEAVLVEHLLAYSTQQLHFAPDDVLRMYVALKTKPFVILAGLTGSGKSTLARLIAEAVGSTAASGAFRRVAVRPDWIDQSEVLGHVNPLSGRFEPGWLAEVARDCERSPERLYVVLLDEMNLAPVEQYMAEYLSSLEEARSGAADVRLPLYSRGASPQNVDEWPHELPFPPNLWLIGTVNVDETTRALSERVLDRANVIQLSVEVSDDHHATSGDAVQPWFVPHGEWKQVCRAEPVDGHHDFLVDIARTLKEVGIGVGARAHIELERFLANAAGVIDDEDALDLGVLQRIVPKVRGFKRDLVEGLEELRRELDSAGCTRCVRVVDRWLDPRTSDDEYLDGTDARIALVT